MKAFFKEFKSFMSRYVFTKFLLIFIVVLLLTFLGLANLNYTSKQIHKLMLILLIVIVSIDAIICTFKITIAGLFLKSLVISIPLGIPFALAFITNDYNASIICAGVVICVLEILNIFFYAWQANVIVEDVYETTDPSLNIYKKHYEGFNDFLALENPKSTLITFAIIAPAKILIMALSIFVGVKAEYVSGEGYYNYWDKTETPWQYKTGQTKIFTQDSLNLAGTIYLIVAGIYLLILITLLVLKFRATKRRKIIINNKKDSSYNKKTLDDIHKTYEDGLF